MRNIAVILGNYMDENGRINDETAKRIDLAADIDSREAWDSVILSGWAYRADVPITLARSMFQYVKEHYRHIADLCICQEVSRDTVGDAVFSYRHIVSKDRSDPIVISIITSDYHLWRSEKIFRFVYKDVVRAVKCYGAITESDELKQRWEKEKRSYKAFRETFRGVEPGHYDAIKTRLLTRHPYYNNQASLRGFY